MLESPSTSFSICSIAPDSDYRPVELLGIPTFSMLAENLAKVRRPESGAVVLNVDNTSFSIGDALLRGRGLRAPLLRRRAKSRAKLRAQLFFSIQTLRQRVDELS